MRFVLPKWQKWFVRSWRSVLRLPTADRAALAARRLASLEENEAVRQADDCMEANGPVRWANH